MPQKNRSNLVIHDKKLPSSVKTDNLNWSNSAEGKIRRKQAVEHQGKIQSACNDAMIRAKRERGTTGMKDGEYRAIIGSIMEEHSARNAFGAIGKRKPATTKTFGFVKLSNGEKKLMQISGPVD